VRLAVKGARIRFDSKLTLDAERGTPMGTPLLLIALAILSVALAYELRFTEATLHLGRSISDHPEGTGFQDAITPPVSTSITYVIYALTLGALIYSFFRFGFFRGIGLLLAFFVLARIWVAVLPPPTSPYFFRLITGSMGRRYADYVRDGDEVRATVMADLLRRAGIEVPNPPSARAGRET
jgi:hypothetical protein